MIREKTVNANQSRRRSTLQVALSQQEIQLCPGFLDLWCCGWGEKRYSLCGRSFFFSLPLVCPPCLPFSCSENDCYRLASWDSAGGNKLARSVLAVRRRTIGWLDSASGWYSGSQEAGQVQGSGAVGMTKWCGLPAHRLPSLLYIANSFAARSHNEPTLRTRNSGAWQTRRRRFRPALSPLPCAGVWSLTVGSKSLVFPRPRFTQSLCELIKRTFQRRISDESRNSFLAHNGVQPVGRFGSGRICEVASGEVRQKE